MSFETNDNVFQTEERRLNDMDSRQGGLVLDFPNGFVDRRSQVQHLAVSGDVISLPVAEEVFDTQLVAVEGISGDLRPSRSLFEGYIGQREAVKDLDKVVEPELASIQESVREWLEQHTEFTEGQDYNTYSRQHVENKMLGLTDFLRTNHADQVNELELTATEAFVASTFAMYEDREGDGVVSPDADGSFAFVVPARMSRKDKDYGQEVEPAIPALRYVPNELRAQMMIGVPPFIIDTYKPDADAKRGYLVLAPIFGDMMEDMPKQGASIGDILNAAREHVDNAVDFAQQRLGVTVAGLGAVIPSLTNFGKAVKNPNVLITNGHGGTAHLVKETAQKAIREGLVANHEHPHVGVLGLGAIGASIAHLAAEEFEPPVEIYDTSEAKRDRTQQSIEAKGRESAQSANEQDLITKSDVIISAIVGRINLSDFDEIPDLEGKVFVDDSQPGSFDPHEVQKHGGTVVWVIARDRNGVIRRDGYDYATMVDENGDLFGCEAEAGSLYQYSQELRDRGMSDKLTARILSKVAVREAVTPAKARLIGALFKKYGIEPSDFQAFGVPVKSREA
jgi:predicted amino acid dehydrogenase